MPQNQPLRFLYLPPSPWSEKAKWAIELSDIEYEPKIYTPMISTAYARWVTRNYTRKLTVPVATQGDLIMEDSFNIAQHANQNRLPGEINLFPPHRLGDIKHWNRVSEDLLARLRVRALPRMKNNDQLKINNLPAIFPQAIKPYLTALSGYGIKNLEKKYALPSNSATGNRYSNVELKTQVSDLLNELRDALNASETDYLLGDFSYADIAMAVVFQAILPPDEIYLPLDAAMRECWTDPELSAEFGDLIAWRDRMYCLHR